MEEPVKILLVDDHEGGLLAMEAVLDSPGYELVKANSGLAALEALCSGDFAMVLLDVQMPEMDGFETAKRIRRLEQGKNVPILFITAIDKDTRYVHLGYDMGAVDYLFKPFDPHVLKAKVAIFAKLYQNRIALEKAHDLLDIRVKERTSELVRVNSELRKEVLEHNVTENALRESENRFRTMADTVPALVWMSGPEGYFNFFNKGWMNFTGQPLECEVNNGWFRRIHSEDLNTFLTAYSEAVREKKDLNVEYRMRRADGEYRWILNIGVPRFTSDGAFLGYTGSCIDITNRKKAEEVLVESERLQKEFVANVSHDFRTPVAAIKGFAETLRRGALQDPKNALNFIKIIEKHAERLEWLVEDLLTISTFESGKAHVQPESINLYVFAMEMTRSLSFLARKRNVVLKLEIPQDVYVWADRAHLHKILQNLITNAVKFNRPGGWVKMTACPNAGKIEISVQDNGIGIPPAHLPRIFERFYRADKSRQREAGDTGLGLHIVKQIVESNGGEISVESVENLGSTFTFTLPSSREEIPAFQVEERLSV